MNGVGSNAYDEVAFAVRGSVIMTVIIFLEIAVDRSLERFAQQNISPCKRKVDMFQMRQR